MTELTLRLDCDRLFTETQIHYYPQMRRVTGIDMGGTKCAVIPADAGEAINIRRYYRKAPFGTGECGRPACPFGVQTGRKLSGRGH